MRGLEGNDDAVRRRKENARRANAVGATIYAQVRRRGTRPREPAIVQTVAESAPLRAGLLIVSCLGQRAL